MVGNNKPLPAPKTIASMVGKKKTLPTLQKKGTSSRTAKVILSQKKAIASRNTFT